MPAVLGQWHLHLCQSCCAEVVCGVEIEVQVLFVFLSGVGMQGGALI